MHNNLSLCLYLTLCAHACISGQARSANQDKIAIIGAGIGGATAAYYLNEELGDAISIDMNLADALGLERVDPSAGRADSPFSIHNGHKFVFEQSSWSAVTLYRMIRRYGLSYFWLQQAAKGVLTKFLRIYHLQQEGTTFERPEDLLTKIGLYNLTQRAMTEENKVFLGESSAAKRFSMELIGGINHVNYNQNNSLNAFAGMVSMLPTTDESLFKIKGGNSLLAKKAIAASNAELFHVEVQEIRKRGKHFELCLKDSKWVGPYAAVIIATPLEHANLIFKDIGLPLIPERKYQTTVTTVIRGSLKASFFNRTTLPPGEYIIAAENALLPFSSLAPLSDYKNGTRLYKVFSSEILQTNLLSALFQPAEVLTSYPWKAYPRFHPPEEYAPFILADGLYYNNALENAASAMEIAAIEGKNSAVLASRHLKEMHQLHRSSQHVPKHEL